MFTEAIINKYVGIGVSWVSLITENLLSHPFIVLRRQCQVNNISKTYHIVPYTLVPVVIHLYQRQSLSVLWKGLGSALLVRGISLGIEDLISKITPWPKELEKHGTFKSYFQHLMLKCVSIAIVTPFFSASLVETVQSDIASEKPAMFDVFREGAFRLMHWTCGKGRLLPIWALVMPTVAFGLCRYLFSTAVQSAISRFLHIRERFNFGKKGALPKDMPLHCSSTVTSTDINATFISLMLTDVVFFPFETVVHRVHLQGTRTIVDNLDNGYSVLPILTNYEGAIDCYDKTIKVEGKAGLYKGFGVMVLQYMVHYMLIRVTKFVITEVAYMWRAKPKPVERTSPSVVYHDGP